MGEAGPPPAPPCSMQPVPVAIRDHRVLLTSNPQLRLSPHASAVSVR